ncbi:MAG: uroporphyrinogen-III synthase [Rickettsiaceae bacterium]|nr:uroporphyrinogen-III synthase [Rickettsiaceae bacterium]
MKKVLLTRDLAQNQKIINALPENKYKFYHEPMIEYSKDLDLINSLKTKLNGETIIITSPFAAKIVAENFAHNNLSAYVVGQHSSYILKKAGIEVILCAESAEKLVTSAPSYPKISDLIYLRGSNITQNIPFAPTEYTIYATNYRKKFGPTTARLILDKEINIITFFSENSGLAFLECYNNLLRDLSISAETNGKNTYLNDVVFLCFSQKIASIFFKVNLKAKASCKPNLDNFLQLFLDEL